MKWDEMVKNQFFEFKILSSIFFSWQSVFSLDDFPELIFFEDECCDVFILHLDLISLTKLPFTIWPHTSVMSCGILR
jgi:hypothetical protein